MTRQERVAHMLSELGEGWEPDRSADVPRVMCGWLRVTYQAGTGTYMAAFMEPATGWLHRDISKVRWGSNPRAAVDCLLRSAHRRHEDHAEILKAAEAARGWAE